MAILNIDTYSTYYFHGKWDTNGPVAVVKLRDNGANKWAQINFYSGGSNSLNNPIIEIGSTVFVNMHTDMVEPVIDTLRNEKPIFFNYNTGTNYAYLGNSTEPVGEEET